MEYNHLPTCPVSVHVAGNAERASYAYIYGFLMYFRPPPLSKALTYCFAAIVFQHLPRRH